MSNSIWDWWFGDVPQGYMAVHRSPSRYTVRRRFLVFLAAIGATHGVGAAWLWADGGAIPVKAQQASVSWSSTASFAMMLANQGPAGDAVPGSLPDAAASNGVSPADAGLGLGADLNSDADSTLSADEQRTERLRQLLDDDDRTEDDGLLSIPDTSEEPDKVADPDDATTPAANELDPAVKDNEGVLAKPFIQPRYPEVEQGRFVLPPLRAVSTDQKPIGNGRIPETVSAGDELNMIALPEDGDERALLAGEAAWPELIRPWAAPNTFSHPLYFEDRMLERHGHERWGCFQPLASGTRFFVTMPMLPYLATVQPPCENIYSKGYYRVGSPTPKFFQRPPLERRAIIVEAAVVSGTFIALP
ncbi:hypothetical protein [Allorhodopirellula heiligendammensis]|nr:hypothetical protein [Allorhodopirellula heiligendammensis]